MKETDRNEREKQAFNFIEQIIVLTKKKMSMETTNHKIYQIATAISEGKQAKKKLHTFNLI